MWEGLHLLASASGRSLYWIKLKQGDIDTRMDSFYFFFFFFFKPPSDSPIENMERDEMRGGMCMNETK